MVTGGMPSAPTTLPPTPSWDESCWVFPAHTLCRVNARLLTQKPCATGIPPFWENDNIYTVVRMHRLLSAHYLPHRYSPVYSRTTLSKCPSTHCSHVTGKELGLREVLQLSQVTQHIVAGLAELSRPSF